MRYRLLAKPAKPPVFRVVYAVAGVTVARTVYDVALTGDQGRVTFTIDGLDPEHRLRDLKGPLVLFLDLCEPPSKDAPRDQPWSVISNTVPALVTVRPGK